MQTYHANDCRRGFNTELRFFNAFRVRDPESPRWLIGIKKATTQEDIEGTDAFADTDRGRIGIQIKSSHSGLREYQLMHPESKVLVLVIGPTFTMEDVRAKTYRLLLPYWKALARVECQVRR